MTNMPTQRGYILLMSVLVASIILAISFGIYALSIKDLILSSYLKDSAVAFGAADKGIECALYWDRGTPANGRTYTIFTTSTAYVFQPTGGGIRPPICDATQLDTSPTWSATNPSANKGLTTFTLTFPDNACAEVSVFKDGDSTTTVVSNGYNLCGPSNATNPRRTQRTIEASYGDKAPSSASLGATCPFTAQANRTIIDFATSPIVEGRRTIVSNGTFAGVGSPGFEEASLMVQANIPPGTYAISAFAYDSHAGRSAEIQDHEQFVVVPKDNNGIGLAFSNPTPDLADGIETASWQGSLGTVTLLDTALFVKAYHDIWQLEDTGTSLDRMASSNDIQPICAAFDRL